VIKKSFAWVLAQLLLVASVLAIPAAGFAAPIVSNTVTSTIVYEDMFDGEVTVEIQHPTVVSCTRAYSDDAGEACEFEVRIKASVEYPIIDLFVYDEFEESIGSVRVEGDSYISTDWQTGTMYISEPDSSGTTTDEYLIGLDWYEDVTGGQVFPVSVTWSPLQKLAKVGSKKLKLKNTKVFSNGTTAELFGTYKLPTNGCGAIDVKYKISSRAFGDLYNHAIVIEDAKGRVIGAEILSVEEDGYRGTTQVIVCLSKWFIDEEEETPRYSVKAGSYKVSIWEWDDYYISFGKSAKATLTFRS